MTDAGIALRLSLRRIRFVALPDSLIMVGFP
jgi:hypothetical protein